MSQHYPPSKRRFNGERGGSGGKTPLLWHLLWYLPQNCYGKMSLVYWDTGLDWLQLYFQLFCFNFHSLITFSYKACSLKCQLAAPSQPWTAEAGYPMFCPNRSDSCTHQSPYKAGNRQRKLPIGLTWINTCGAKSCCSQWCSGLTEVCVMLVWLRRKQKKDGATKQSLLLFPHSEGHSRLFMCNKGNLQPKFAWAKDLHGQNK